MTFSLSHYDSDMVHLTYLILWNLLSIVLNLGSIIAQPVSFCNRVASFSTLSTLRSGIISIISSRQSKLEAIALISSSACTGCLKKFPNLSSSYSNLTL